MARSSGIQILQSTDAKVMTPLASMSVRHSTSGAEDSSLTGGIPKPLSPLVLPLGYASLLPGGGARLVGASNGIVLLLLLPLYVLASGLPLLRRDVKLSKGFWELSKPSSALLGPL